MLFLLPISSEEYIKQFSSELIGESPIYLLDDLKGEIFGSQLYELYSVRIYVSLTAAKKELPKFNEEDAEYYKTICNNIHKINKAINMDDEIDSYFPMGVVLNLLNYAKECYNSLNSSLEKDVALSYIKGNMLKNEIDINYYQISTFIDKYRKELLIYFEKH